MAYALSHPFRTMDGPTTYENEPDDRVILLFDMDCFEVQVHEKPHQRGKPRVVVNSSDRIVAVSYEAKKLSINRDSTPYLKQAIAKYKDIIPIYMPTRQGLFNGPPRPDSRPAREASARIVNAIKSSLNRLDGENLTTLQFSSSDEFYVDVTKLVNKMSVSSADLWQNTFLYNETVNGTPNPNETCQRLNDLVQRKTWSLLSRMEEQEVRLLMGSTIGNTIIVNILQETSYQSSVGMGSNMTMAKIASGTHKPGSITIFAPSGFENLSKFIKIEDIPGLGGKIGSQIKQHFNATTMDKLRNIPEMLLENFRVDDGGRVLGHEKAMEILCSARGICKKQVVAANCYKTSGVSRKLYGNTYCKEDIFNILIDHCEEIVEKIEFEKRINFRVPATIKFSLTTTSPNLDNVHALIETDGYQVEDAESLYYDFLQNCEPSISNWSPNYRIKLDELKVTATF